LKEEGWDVVLRIDDLWMRENLDGVVEKTNRMPKMSDVVIFDGVGNGEEASKLVEEGFMVVGGGRFSDDLVFDYEEMLRKFDEKGIKVVETVKCESIKEAREFVESSLDRWIVKVAGRKLCYGNKLTMLNALQVIERVRRGEVECLLQKEEEGIKVVVNGWWNGEGWIEGGFSLGVEGKRWLVGELGVKTKGEWWVVCGCKQIPELAMQLHYKMDELLEESNYIGPVGVEAIVSPRGVFLCEAWAGLGWSGLEAQSVIMQRPLGEMLISLCEREEFWPVDYEQVGLSLKVSIPPYPFAQEDNEAEEGVGVIFGHEDRGKIWLSGVKKEGGRIVTSGTNGVVGVIATQEKRENLWQGRDNLLAIAGRLQIPDLMYRNDPASQVEEVWMKLAQMGYETPFSSYYGIDASIPQPLSG
jgi:phosphoribosylamine---glycine ligase